MYSTSAAPYMQLRERKSFETVRRVTSHNVALVSIHAQYPCMPPLRITT